MRNACWIRTGTLGGWLRFREPRAIVVARTVGEVLPALRLVERRVEEEGLHAAGFLSYEAAAAFDVAHATLPPAPVPLLWFGLYPSPETGGTPPVFTRSAYRAGPWAHEVDRETYDRAIGEIKERIAAGETYQANYTFRLRAPFRGNDLAFFFDLAGAQGPCLAAYVDAHPFAVCSASPELFFRLEGDRLTARPMKGTAARGCEASEDEGRAARLRLSEKERAENVMIVDMLRNDMGRIASPGTVRVPSLFDLEKYPTVWQMTSTVVASTSASVSEIFGALFPSASVTGAPKIRTMRILSRLERSPRGVYTGAIGRLSPGRRASFQVAIRTAVVDRERGEAEYGVGGGIVWDSTADSEYDECLTKTRLLGTRRAPFSLLDTILWTPDEGFLLLDLHLERLRASARYFDFPLVEAEVLRRLRSVPDRTCLSPCRVRLLLGPEGDVNVEAAEHVPAAGRVRVAVAPDPIDPSDCFLYHKTTHRRVYDEARAAAPEAEDVLLWNPRGEVTESCTANIVVEANGRPVTPPIGCGLLAGTYRRHLLERGEIEERVVTLEELQVSRRIWLINSVAGRREARLVAAPDANEGIDSPVSSREGEEHGQVPDDLGSLSACSVRLDRVRDRCAPHGGAGASGPGVLRPGRSHI